MNKKEKLHIAKEAYKGIKHAIDQVTDYKDGKIIVDYPGYIIVDDIMFFERELQDEKNS